MNDGYLVLGAAVIAFALGLTGIVWVPVGVSVLAAGAWAWVATSTMRAGRMTDGDSSALVILFVIALVIIAASWGGWALARWLF